jgi:hypothetical protein
VQSLILSAVLMIVGFQVILIGLIADLIAGHRRISEDILYRVKQLELRGEKAPAAPAPEPSAASGPPAPR